MPATTESLLSDRVAPQDPAAERAVLGCCLVAGADALARLGGLVSEDFALDSHRQIFAAIMRLAADGHDISLLTVTADLRDAGVLEGVGGCVEEALIEAMVADAARIVREARASGRLRALRACVACG